jgi:predicted  nucleic acid-binding Zn-ribbon protein
MHPEVTGVAGSGCPECGMELTEKVTQTTAADNESTPVAVANEESSAITATGNVSKTAFPTDAIVSNYLNIKNALTKDDSNGAAVAARNLLITLNSSSTTSLDTKSKNKYNAFVADAKAHVKHIGDNSGKMEHQREYFSLLSQDIFGLIKTFGTKQTVYQDYCPMYGEGKTGYWISETKDVINPYFGSEMLNCGRRIGAVK